MRLDQLDPVAERILHVPALATFDRLVFILDLVAGASGFFDNVTQSIDDERGVRLAGRDKILVDAEMNRQGAVPEPAPAACDQLWRFGDFGESQNILIKRPRLALPPSRHGNQNVVNRADGHLSPCMCQPTLYPARHGPCQSQTGPASVFDSDLDPLRRTLRNAEMRVPLQGR